MAAFHGLAASGWLSYLALGVWYVMQAYVGMFYAYVFSPVLLYLVCAARIGRLYRRRAPAAPAQTDFVLLVPAHNEAALLPGLLASIAQLDYPAGRFRTVVVADNCTDGTAVLARAAGATCLVRRTAHPSSKVQALRFGAAQLALGAAQPAAVVCVLDADCQLDPHFLTELDRYFAQPGAAPVVQCSRRVGNAFESDVTVLDAAAEALRQRVGLGARALLGFDAFILGLGCCLRAAEFARLMALPQTSLAEDKEWKADLVRRQVPVAYCPAASLRYHTVGSQQAFGRQRQRWLAGQLASAKTHGLPLLAQGLAQGSLRQLDFACELLQPPRSCLLVVALAFGAVALGTGQAVLGWVW
ncbi:MAG: glycosyltransferase, partial [Hymenobacter sp.]